VTSILLKYGSFLKKDRQNIENLITSFACLSLHLDRLNLRPPPNLNDLVYATWYLNDNSPEVWT